MRLLPFLLLSTLVLTAQAQSSVSVVAYPEHMVGRKTASGATYNPHGLTAAHPSLPFGSMLELSAPGTGRSVMVEVNDRGLMMGEGLMIVSPAALDRLGLTGDEEVTVAVRHWRQGNRPAIAQGSRSASSRDGARTAETRSATSGSATGSSSTTPGAPPAPPSAAPTPSASRTIVPTGAATQFAIQMGSFSDRAAALTLAGTLDGAWIQTGSVDGRDVYRVLFGHFSQRAEAEGWQARLSGLGVQGYVRSVPN
ncbi:MAG: hypothetical protein HKN29_01310 [Rhodothermales bacterium]|nr:hypothetical protein [Rhodothermales bacterium]